jgi:DNA-binding protein HU-beta
MNKTQLVEQIAEQTGVTKQKASEMVDVFTSAIEGSLEKGESVSLPGFGTFEVRQRNARKGRNPQTGEEIDIAASNAPAFKPGKALKAACNK